MKAVNKHDLDVFRRILDAGQKSRILLNPEDIAPYCSDWTGKYTCRGVSAVLQPESTEQVSRILSHCSAERIGIVPQGGLTGLVGGAVPICAENEVILNLSRMDKIIDVNAIEQRASFDAGVILENADIELRRHGLMAPIDLGAKGSCQIGGLIACNAGGTRYRLYGGLHANCAGLEVVLPDGMILNLRGSLMRKNNTGLDLKHLFIGSEGTLGIITKADLYCPKAPKSTTVAILSIDDYGNIPSIFTLAQEIMGSNLAAFEFWDADCEALVGKHLKKSIRRNPSPFSVLLEGHGSDGHNLDTSLQSLLELLSNKDLIKDALIAHDSIQEKALWSIREGMPEACSKEGIVAKYDISLPIRVMYDIVRHVYNQHPGVKAVGFGHVGDGNLHLNVINAQNTPNLDRLVYDFVHKHAGSISAEHGIGQLKLSEYQRSTDPSRLFVCQLIKQQLDPFGIMNPGKLYPPNFQGVLAQQSNKQ